MNTLLYRFKVHPECNLFYIYYFWHKEGQNSSGEISLRNLRSTPYNLANKSTAYR